MKRIILATVMVLSSVLVFAQDNRTNRQNTNTRTSNGNRNQAPNEVQQAWQRDHANDGTPTWQQSNGQWHARYQDKNNNRNVDTYYDRSGRQVDTHREWNSNDMPHEYNQTINRRYHTNGNYDVTRIERPNQSEVYRLNIKNKGKKRTVYTDKNGKEIRYREPHIHD